jgi:hypothetical protein
MVDYTINIIDEMTESYYPEGIGLDFIEDQLEQLNANIELPEFKSPIIVLFISNIVKKLSEEFKNIKDSSMKELFFALFQSLQNNLISFRSKSEGTSHLPQIHISFMEDDSIFIEWIFYDFRIGFSIEKEIKQSSWYLVSNKNLENVAKSGYFDKQNVDLIIRDLFAFIYINT